MSAAQRQLQRRVATRFVRAHPVLSLLPEADLAALCRSVEVKVCTSGQMLYAEGDEAYVAYLVMDGTVDATLAEADGRSMLARTFEPGDIFGLDDVIDRMPRSESCLAVGRVTLVRLPLEACRLLDRSTAVSRALAHNTRESLRAAQTRLRRLTLCDLETRMLLYLKEHAGACETAPGGAVEIALKDTQTRLAAKMHASRTRVNITLQRWVKTGDVTTEPGRITVHRSAQFWDKCPK